MTKSIYYIIIVFILCQSCSNDSDINYLSDDDLWYELDSNLSATSDMENDSMSEEIYVKNKTIDQVQGKENKAIISNILDPTYSNIPWKLGLIFPEEYTSKANSQELKLTNTIIKTTNLSTIIIDSFEVKSPSEIISNSNNSPLRNTLITQGEDISNENNNSDLRSGETKEKETPLLRNINRDQGLVVQKSYTDTTSIFDKSQTFPNKVGTNLITNNKSRPSAKIPIKQKDTIKSSSVSINPTVNTQNDILNKKMLKPDILNNSLPKRKVSIQGNTQRSRDKYIKEKLKSNDVDSTISGFVEITALHKVPSYRTNKKHTVLLKIKNLQKQINDGSVYLQVPETWSVISVSALGSMDINQVKKVLLSFYLPPNAENGIQSLPIYIADYNNDIVASDVIEINVAPNYELDVFNVSAPQNVRAGEMIEAIYAVKNIGNMPQKIIVSSNMEIKGESNSVLEPGAMVLVNLSKVTNPNIYSFRHQSANIEVLGVLSGKKYKAFKSVEVFPVKIKKEEIYFKFPVRASLYYNSYTAPQDHFSTMSFEVTGNGHLDLKKEHFLDFIIRGPKQNELRQFGNNDQYSIIYEYKDQTKLYLGDHSYFINRLGINGKYGMGFKIDQKVHDWTMSVFYTKPRLYDFDASSYYGVKSYYRVNDFLKLGASLTTTKRIIASPNQKFLSLNEEKGEILTMDLDYSKKGTHLVAEASASSTNEYLDFGQYVNFRKELGNFFYSGSIISTGKNYLGTINNSLQFTNAINYRNNGWNFGLGQGLSRVNQRLNPLYYAAEPYYENYYSTLGYRLNQHHNFRLRLDKRVREDKLEPKNYHYREYGVNYTYAYNSSRFLLNFNGRFGKTQNLLSNDFNYRNTYSHNINLSYSLDTRFRIRGGVNHIFTNRYGNIGNNQNYIRYNLGFNYNFNKNFIFNANFNSGYNLEDSYLKRDYISLNLLARFPKNHLFEIRANYFENPGIIGKREIFAYGKYTYSFGVPIKKIKEQGGVMGYVVANDISINTNKIKIIAAGKTVMTDKDGKFEINNLPLGKNYILVEQSSMDQGVITSSRIPYEVIISEKRIAELNIILVKSSTVKGSIEVKGRKNLAKTGRMDGFVKLENKDFTYYTESDRNGQFNFFQIVPGTYEITILRLKENDQIYYAERTSQLSLKEGEVTEAKMFLTQKERKITFKNKKFKVGNYE